MKIIIFYFHDNDNNSITWKNFIFLDLFEFNE